MRLSYLACKERNAHVHISVLVRIGLWKQATRMPTTPMRDARLQTSRRFQRGVAQRTACDRCALVTSISPATVPVLSVNPTTGALTAVAGTGVPEGRLGVAFLALSH